MMFVLSKAHRRLWRLFASPTFTTCGYSSSRKKVSTSPSRYASAETERLQVEYQGLVQDLVAARCAQGSGSETQRRAPLRSPVLRFRSPADEQREAPEVPFPFLNDERHQDEGGGGDDDDEVEEEEEVMVAAPAPIRVEGPRAGGLASVTRVLQDTMPLQQRYVLERWKRRMILELGREGFDRYSLGVLRQGRKLHAVIQEALTQRLSNPGVDMQLATVMEEAAFACEEESKEDNELLRGYAQSVQPVLADLGRVRAVEGKVQHKRLQYMGHIDCLAEYRGQLCLIDWKTSEKPKPKLRDTYDNPLQVVAYAGAVNYDANYAPLQTVNVASLQESIADQVFHRYNASVFPTLPCRWRRAWWWWLTGTARRRIRTCWIRRSAWSTGSAGCCVCRSSTAVRERDIRNGQSCDAQRPRILRA